MSKDPGTSSSGAPSPGEGTEEDIAQTVAEQNRRKLEEHLAKLQQKGVPPKGKGGKATTGDKPKAPPKPPPKPAGWEAWKRAHGGSIHRVTPVDAAELSREADFRLLELKPGASQDEIKRNFNRLAKKFHPDLGGDGEIFQALRQAYNRLSKGG